MVFGVPEGLWQFLKKPRVSMEFLMCPGGHWGTPWSSLGRMGGSLCAASESLGVLRKSLGALRTSSDLCWTLLGHPRVSWGILGNHWEPCRVI